MGLGFGSGGPYHWGGGGYRHGDTAPFFLVLKKNPQLEPVLRRRTHGIFKILKGFFCRLLDGMRQLADRSKGNARGFQFRVVQDSSPLIALRNWSYGSTVLVLTGGPMRASKCQAVILASASTGGRKTWSNACARAVSWAGVYPACVWMRDTWSCEAFGDKSCKRFAPENCRSKTVTCQNSQNVQSDEKKQ